MQTTQRQNAPVRSLALGLLVVALAGLTGCDDGASRPSRFETSGSLQEAAEAAPGFSCDSSLPAERIEEVGMDAIRSDFPGLREFGACVSGGRSRYLIVFEDDTSLDQFVDSQRWVDFHRILEPVDDGQRFTGAAGDNWIIAGYDPSPGFLEEMGAERVESPPAASS